VGPDGVQLAQVAQAGELCGGDEFPLAPALGSGLEHAAVSPFRVAQGLPLGDGQCAGLFAVDILARSHGHNRSQGVPAVARGDEQGVDIVACGQKFAQVDVLGAVLAAVARIHQALNVFAARFPDVADRHEVHILLAEHPVQDACAAAADADGAHHDALAGGDSTVLAQRCGRDDGRGGEGTADESGAAQELPPAHALCLGLPIDR